MTTKAQLTTCDDKFEFPSVEELITWLLKENNELAEDWAFLLVDYYNMEDVWLDAGAFCLSRRLYQDD